MTCLVIGSILGIVCFSIALTDHRHIRKYEQSLCTVHTDSQLDIGCDASSYKGTIIVALYNSLPVSDRLCNSGNNVTLRFPVINYILFPMSKGKVQGWANNILSTGFPFTCYVASVTELRTEGITEIPAYKIDILFLCACLIAFGITAMYCIYSIKTVNE